MTNEEILKVYQGITELINKKAVLNIKTSYTLAKNKSVLTPFVQVIENERIKIYDKYGTRSEEGNITVPNERIPELEKDADELLAIENKVPIVKIKIDDLADAEIGLDILENLMPIIIEE